MLPFSILRYIARAVGEGAAESVRAAAGETKSMEELAEWGAWTSARSLLQIAEKSGRLTGDSHIGRRGGEELARLHMESGITDFIVAEGSVTAALDMVIASSSRVSVGRVSNVVDRADGSVLIEGRSRPGALTSPVFCDFS